MDMTNIEKQMQERKFDLEVDDVRAIEGLQDKHKVVDMRKNLELYGLSSYVIAIEATLKMTGKEL